MSKTVVITGANAGIGFETAKELASQGWAVKMICRNPQKAKAAAQQIKVATNHFPKIYIADLKGWERRGAETQSRIIY